MTAASQGDIPSLKAGLTLPEIMLLDGGIRRKCGLLGITNGMVYLLSWDRVDVGSSVSVHFSRIVVSGLVVNCTQKEDGHLIFVRINEARKDRAEPRFPVDLPCTATILSDECRTAEGRLLDFSQSGTGLRLSVPCAVGNMMYVETDTLFITGGVRHCSKNEAGDYTVGLANEDILIDVQAPARQPWLKRTRWRFAQWILGHPIRY